MWVKLTSKLIATAVFRLTQLAPHFSLSRAFFLSHTWQTDSAERLLFGQLWHTPWQHCIPLTHCKRNKGPLPLWGACYCLCLSGIQINVIFAVVCIKAMSMILTNSVLLTLKKYMPQIGMNLFVFAGCQLYLWRLPARKMSSKMQSSNNIAQARRIVQQLRIEANIERIKVKAPRSWSVML